MTNDVEINFQMPLDDYQWLSYVALRAGKPAHVLAAELLDAVADEAIANPTTPFDEVVRRVWDRIVPGHADW